MQTKKKWYPLDNAANIYPVIASRHWTPMYRMQAVLTEDVRPALLQEALSLMGKRFPYFIVRLRRGIFWYYFEELPRTPTLQEDTNTPCGAVLRGELPFRVKHWGNRIAIEFSHMIADGGGALVFFKTLLAQYVRLLGTSVPNEHGILDVTAPAQSEEYEDAFDRFSRMGVRPSRMEPRAYQPKGTRLPTGMRLVTTGVLSVKEALAKAKSYKVTLTEYLTAVLMHVLYLEQEAETPRYRRPVKVSVPINLRKYYKTKTLRNFSQYLNPGIDPNLGDFTFEETLDQVHHYFRYMFTEKNMNARISKNVGDERNWALRMVPLFLKKLGIGLVFELSGECVFSTVISNVGVVDLPPAMEPYFERFDTLLCTAKRNAVECAVMSFQDQLSVTFTRSIAEPYVERIFFRALVRQGLHVLIESNQG